MKTIQAKKLPANVLKNNNLYIDQLQKFLENTGIDVLVWQSGKYVLVYGTTEKLDLLCEKTDGFFSFVDTAANMSGFTHIVAKKDKNLEEVIATIESA